MVKVQHIKGFKLHSTQKDLWVNLICASVNTNSDANGNREASITVGKMGITVDVQGQLPPEAYQPLETILFEAKTLGNETTAPSPLGISTP
jgi:hypothetical protein